MYLLLICSILFASLNSVLLHKLPSKSNINIFNMICALIWMVILFAVNGFSLTFSKEVIVWGIIYGIVQELFMFFKAQAMNTGAVSITTLIGNCSLILSTSVGIIVWKEIISVPQIIGILILICAFFLCTYSKSKDDKKASGKWLFYCVCFFVLAAAVGIIFKAFSKSSNGAGADDMMIFAAIVMLLFSALKIFIGYQITPKEERKKISLTKAFIIIALISGVLSCAYNRLNISLSGMFDSAIFYPCFNGGVILLSAVLSVIFLKEKLTKRQLIGLFLGVCAIVTVGIF